MKQTDTDFRLRREEAMLLALLRAALWEQAADYGPFEAADETVWKRVRQLATEQGVQAIACDGMMRLPAPLQPPREIRMAWTVNTERLAEHNRRYKGVAASLAGFYAAHGIPAMLMKGPGLAQLYPIPEHRESGDLDIWLFGRWADGDRLMQAQGIEVERHSPKHSNFYYEGIPVENHRTFLNVEQYAVDRRLEKALHVLLPPDGHDLQTMDGAAPMLLPPPLFNALFLARHMTNHFLVSIVLRHLCDWARFLTVCHGQYSRAEFLRLMDETGLNRVMRSFTEICVRYLGMSPEVSPFATDSGREEGEASAGNCEARNCAVSRQVSTAMVLGWILRPRYTLQPEGASAFRIIVFKLKRLFERRLRYRMIYGKNFGRHILSSIVAHIVHPSTILRLK